MRALYGFDRTLAPFNGKTHKEIVSILGSWGVNAIFGGYEDETLVEDLHRVGIKVYAEFPVFTGEKYWKRFPESRPIKANGNPIEKDHWYAGVTPSAESVRKERLEALKTLVAAYNLDGIWLDFIRWPCHWEVHNPKIEETSFDPVSLSKFQKEAKIEMPASLKEKKAKWILSQHRSKWTLWKCDVVTSFVKKARSVIKGSDKHKLVGIFTVPWTPADYNNAIERIIGQNYKNLGKFIDVFSPMVYHLMCNRDVNWIARVTEYAHKASGKPVCPIIQAVSEPCELSAFEFKEALITALETTHSKGVIIFAMNHMLKENKMKAMKAVFLRN